MRVPTAPVNAPFSWPNISVSSSSDGIAPQFTAMKGLLERRLLVWMNRAISSLPVPLSPAIKTVESVGATRWQILRIFSITGCDPFTKSFPWPSRNAQNRVKKVTALDAERKQHPPSQMQHLLAG